MATESRPDYKAALLWRQVYGLFFFMFSLCLLGCSPVTQHEPESGDSSSKQQTSIQESRKIEFVAFSAKWCEVCRGTPAVLEKLRGTFPTVTFRDLDIDDEANSKLWSEYGSDAVPYNYVLIDGKVRARFRGFLPFDHAERFVREALKKPDSPRNASPAEVAGSGQHEKQKNQSVPFGEGLLGSSREFVRSEFGKPDRTSLVFDTFNRAGVILGYDDDDRVKRLTATHLASGDSYKGKVLGIALGDTKKQCIAVWGAPIKTKETSSEYEEIIWHHNGYIVELNVWVKDGVDGGFGKYKKDTVKSIAISKKPE